VPAGRRSLSRPHNSPWIGPDPAVGEQLREIAHDLFGGPAICWRKRFEVRRAGFIGCPRPYLPSTSANGVIPQHRHFAKRHSRRLGRKPDAVRAGRLDHGSEKNSEVLRDPRPRRSSRPIASSYGCHEQGSVQFFRLQSLTAAVQIVCSFVETMALAVTLNHWILRQHRLLRRVRKYLRIFESALRSIVRSIFHSADER